MTAHKVQGQTVRNSYVYPVYRGFDKEESTRMFYTSITRPTDKLVIFDKEGNNQANLNNFLSKEKESSTITEQIDEVKSMNEIVNHSGGAYGGDTFWDLIGREFGVINHLHYKDAGNANLSQQLRNKGVKATILTKEQMDFARKEVKRLLGIDYADDLRGNLQVRNFYQVYNADAVYAVAKIASSTKPEVYGGTNTAVQLGIKLNKPVYVWDIDSEQWYTQDTDFLKTGFDKTKHEWNYNGWKKTETPTLTKNFAGIGSRDIENYNVQIEGKWQPRKEYVGKEKEEKAKQAIRDVYENTLNSFQPKSEVKPNTNIQGVEINSYQKGLGNSLTNVHYAKNGKSEFDIVPSDKTLKLTTAAKNKWGESVEAWYKSNNAQTKGIPEGEQGDKYDFDLMIGLITDKLTQYPNLVQQINERGGLEFLQKSTHTMGSGRWSSKNPKNMFMNSLIQAYKNVTQSEVKPVSGEVIPAKKEITKEDTDKLPPCIG